MPNYVTSRCAVRGPAAEVERFKATTFRTYETGDRYLDFGAAIPMPASIAATQDETGGAGMGVAMILAAGGDPAPFSRLGLYDHEIEFVRREAGLAYDASISDVARAFIEKKPEIAAMGRNRLQAVVETGYTYWYPWANANWGTKWNSFRLAETSADPFEFRFETAWSFPTPVFEKLAEMFPDLSFACVCYDEGSNFAGVGSFNPLPGEPAFAIVEASDELYERAHGEPKPVYEDEDA